LFVNSLVVDTLDFNIYEVGRLRGRRRPDEKQKTPKNVRTSGIALQRFWTLDLITVKSKAGSIRFALQDDGNHPDSFMCWHAR
jgi:hypothetical protein